MITGRYDAVIVRRNGDVVELVLNRAEARNALSTPFAAELGHAALKLGDLDGVRAVVITSASDDAFCVGADLKERATFTITDFAAQRVTFRRLFDGLRALPMPTVAAVSGWALGGGFEIALCCDLIVADQKAIFGLPEVTLGMVPGGGGTQSLPRRVGPGAAADLLLTGRKVNVEEAAALRIVDRHVSKGEARDAALDLARLIAANSPSAVRTAKSALHRGLDTDVAAGLDIEESAWQTTIRSADRQEGIAAFVEKRKPVWSSHRPDSSPSG